MGQYSICIAEENSNVIEQMASDILVVCNAINNLPVKFNIKKRLPVFAVEVTTDPHSFDRDNWCGKLLLYGLAYVCHVDLPDTAEKRAEIYYRCGILFDEVSGNILCKGVQGYTLDGIHFGWKGFYDQNEVIAVTLSNVSRLVRIESPNKKVFVVENPAVFSAISDCLEDLQVALICTSGQLRVVALAVLDLLVQSGCTLFYSGDFDPEGLQIADKLWQRFEDKLVLWHFNIESYRKSLSNKQISSIRMTKLKSITNTQLKELATEIMKCGYAGYQESIVDELVDDLIRRYGF